jgi:predicted transposase YdaD
MRESIIYQEILGEGRAEGKVETTRKLPLNLLIIGMSLEQITEITELSLEQVQTLQKEI